MIKKILCAVDFSEYTEEVVAYALEVSKRFDAELHLIHVIPLVACIAPYETFLLPEHMLEMERNMDREAEEQFERLLKRLHHPAKKVVRKGIAFLEIVEYAREEGIDLIVVGTHGRTGVQHMLIGSVAEKVVRKSPCPVLTVRPRSSLR
jgi:nucleotide-binding universal stress UspA family protein